MQFLVFVEMNTLSNPPPTQLNYAKMHKCKQKITQICFTTNGIKTSFGAFDGCIALLHNPQQFTKHPAYYTYKYEF